MLTMLNRLSKELQKLKKERTRQEKLRTARTKAANAAAKSVSKAAMPRKPAAKKPSKQSDDAASQGPAGRPSAELSSSAGPTSETKGSPSEPLSGGQPEPPWINELAQKFLIADQIASFGAPVPETGLSVPPIDVESKVIDAAPKQADESSVWRTSTDPGQAP